MADGDSSIYATEVLIPGCTAVGRIGRNAYAQQVVPQQQVTLVGTPADGLFAELNDGRHVPVVSRERSSGASSLSLAATADEIRDVPSKKSLARGRWLAVPDPTDPDGVSESHLNAFRFRSPKTGLELRPPQSGAVHSVLGYWTTAPSEPATVVMPTGTGKTDTMVSIFVATAPRLLLVVVPSDALRAQIASKFETLGILPSLGLLSSSAGLPVVGQIKHQFADATEAQSFAEACNVIIATPQVLTGPGEGATALLAACTHLFVDEAHHVAASTWTAIRNAFDGKPVVQFTATPFREDGKHLGGRVIYAFPLREAQAQGYFSRINYRSIPDLGEHDTAIASAAVQQLRDDLEAGHDHILMARVSRIGRADDLVPIYRLLAPEFNPVIVHSTTPAAERRAAHQAILNRTSRIIVCVNMFGEGFDLPELKIAAIHDPHKTIGITLQFVGRFARSSPTLGDATVVVGRPDRDYDPELRKLFAEDADWNRIIRDLSENEVFAQLEASDFEGASRMSGV
jgi:superfamily II DNA or RNA helicase